MLKRNEFVINISLVIFIFLAVNGCTNISAPQPQNSIILEDAKTEEELPPSETPASPPMRVDLSLSRAPALGETAEVIAVINYTGKIKENVPETTANIILPAGFELINGNSTWSGYLKKEPTQFSITVKAVQTGNWTIEAKARSPPTGDTYFDGRDSIYITVLEDRSMISGTSFSKPAEPCAEMYIDGELVRCTTSEPIGILLKLNNYKNEE